MLPDDRTASRYPGPYDPARLRYVYIGWQVGEGDFTPGLQFIFPNSRLSKAFKVQQRPCLYIPSICKESTHESSSSGRHWHIAPRQAAAMIRVVSSVSDRRFSKVVVICFRLASLIFEPAPQRQTRSACNMVSLQQVCSQSIHICLNKIQGFFKYFQGPKNSSSRP